MTLPRPSVLSVLFVAVALVVVFAAVSMLGVGGGEAPASAGGPVDLSALAADPAGHRGDEVIVSGRVDERYGPGVFAIGKGEDEIVVLAPTRSTRRGLGGRPAAGSLRVTGQARRVGKDLRSALGADYVVREHEAAVVASRIQRLGCARGPDCPQR